MVSNCQCSPAIVIPAIVTRKPHALLGPPPNQSLPSHLSLPLRAKSIYFHPSGPSPCYVTTLLSSVGSAPSPGHIFFIFIGKDLRLLHSLVFLPELGLSLKYLFLVRNRRLRRIPIALSACLIARYPKRKQKKTFHENSLVSGGSRWNATGGPIA